MHAVRTWVSGPQREVSGPGFQALNARFQDLESSPSYGRLIFSLRPPPLFFFPPLSSASTVTFLCVQWSQTDRRHRFCRRIKTRNCRVRRTHRRTQGRSEFIYKICTSYIQLLTLTHTMLVWTLKRAHFKVVCSLRLYLKKACTNLYSSIPLSLVLKLLFYSKSSNFILLSIYSWTSNLKYIIVD